MFRMQVDPLQYDAANGYQQEEDVEIEVLRPVKGADHSTAGAGYMAVVIKLYQHNVPGKNGHQHRRKVKREISCSGEHQQQSAQQLCCGQNKRYQRRVPVIKRLIVYGLCKSLKIQQLGYGGIQIQYNQQKGKNFQQDQLCFHNK
jgi:hypothetical protein